MTLELPTIFWGFRFLLVILATYRLAKLISEDDGPFFIFKRIRYWAKDKAWVIAEENGQTSYFDDPPTIDDRWFEKWHSLAEGLECSYCVGFWISMPLFLMLLFPTQLGDLFLVFISISAGQAFLQGLKR